MSLHPRALRTLFISNLLRMSSGESSGPVAKGVCKFFFVFFVVAKEELIGSEYWINIIKMTTNLSRKHSEKKNSQAPNVACCIVTLFFQNLGRHIVCCEKKFRYHHFIELRGHLLKEKLKFSEAIMKNMSSRFSNKIYGNNII